ncbi:MobH family relaxase [Acidihalobacter ferrooxydans]|nr:MobH family relaxase [Acidihalobacter ferrooxydans]
MPSTPRWPPVEGGLPAVGLDELLESQSELLTILRHSVGEEDALWQAHYWPVIQRFASWAHLLPASREHHHYGAGGLWRHSLEAARAAADLFERHVVGQNLPREERIRYRRGMRWACVCGALLHDCAKPMTDVEVTDDAGRVWNPVQGSLTAWLKATGATRYTLRWRTGRAGQHAIGAAIMLPRVMGWPALIWLQSQCGQSVLLELTNALMDDTRQGLLPEVIHEADRLSVADDLSRRPDINEDHRITGVAAEGHILDAARSLIREGRWRIGGKVCALADDGDVLLAWPRAGTDIGNWLAEHQIPGVVRTPESVANVLLDTGKAIPCGDELHWKFRSQEGVVISGLRIKAGTLELEGAPVGGRWVNDEAASTQEKTAPASKPKADTEPEPEPAQEAAPLDKDLHRKIASCPVAAAIFDDLARGEKPIDWLYRFESDWHLRYPDAFKGCGMSPMQAAKELVAAQLADSDGKRIAQETGDTRGVRLRFTGNPLPTEAAFEALPHWFEKQTEGVVDIRGIRFIESGRARRWAALFGDPEEVIHALLDAQRIVEGSMKDRGNKSYVRLEKNSDEA